MKKFLGPTITALLLTTLPAQSVKDARSGFEFAQYEVEQKRPETAAKALHEAYALLKTLPASEKSKDSKLEKEVTSLLRQIDPNGKKLVDSRLRAAKDLKRIAANYTKLDWNDTALKVLIQAQTLYAPLVADDLQSLRKKLAADAGRRFEKAGKNKDLLTWFHLGDRPYFNDDPWTFSDFGMMAPKTDEKSGQPFILSNKELQGDVRIQIEIKPGPSGSAGLVWNYRRERKKDRYQVSAYAIELNPRLAQFTVLQTENNNDQIVGRGTLIMDAFKNAWIPVEIEVRGKNVTIKITKNSPVEFKMFGPNKGYLAMFFEAKNRIDPQAQFRHLSIEHLDK